MTIPQQMRERDQTFIYNLRETDNLLPVLYIWIYEIMRIYFFFCPLEFSAVSQIVNIHCKLTPSTSHCACMAMTLTVVHSSSQFLQGNKTLENNNRIILGEFI